MWLQVEKRIFLPIFTQAKKAFIHRQRCSCKYDDGYERNVDG